MRADTGSNTPNYTVSIHSANADGTPGSTNLGTLTNPSKLVVGSNRFTAPAGGIELKPNTTYVVVVDLTNDGDKFFYETTAADNEGWGRRLEHRRRQTLQALEATPRGRGTTTFSGWPSGANTAPPPRPT